MVMAIDDHPTEEEKLQFLDRARAVERKAREFYKEEQYEKAGLWYGWSGYAYEKAQKWELAGHNYGQSGEAYRRAEKWEKAGLSYVRSAEAYEKVEKWLVAGLNYNQAGLTYEKAGLFAKAGENYRRSGEAYKQAERWQEVGLSYEQSGEACKRAEAWRAAGLSFAQSGEAYKNAKDWSDAEDSFCKAKIAYNEGGMYEDSGAMYYKEMVMKRMQLKKRSWARFLSFMYDLACGYGEKPQNIITVGLGSICLFAVVTFIADGLSPVNFTTPKTVWGKFFDAFYFSTLTFTSLGYGDIHPKEYIKPVVMLEALLGTFLITLFIMVSGRKMMRR